MTSMQQRQQRHNKHAAAVAAVTQQARSSGGSGDTTSTQRHNKHVATRQACSGGGSDTTSTQQRQHNECGGSGGCYDHDSKDLFFLLLCDPLTCCGLTHSPSLTNATQTPSKSDDCASIVYIAPCFITIV